jgi:hypothetical protein
MMNRRKWAAQFEISWRIGTGAKWFEFDAVWHENKRYERIHAAWWPRVIVTLLGLSVGFGVFIGKALPPEVPR